MIVDHRGFRCPGYIIEPRRPGGSLILCSPSSGAMAAEIDYVEIPQLAKGLPGLIDALDRALRSPARLGSFAGNVTFSTTDDDKDLRIISGTYTVLMDRALADNLLRILELMQ